jgi:hypothetical protein
MDMHISIIYGSVRSERKGIIAARYLEKKLKERNIKVSLVDPLVYKLPLLDLMYKEYEPGSAPGMYKPLNVSEPKGHPISFPCGKGLGINQASSIFVCIQGKSIRFCPSL